MCVNHQRIQVGKGSGHVDYAQIPTTVTGHKQHHVLGLCRLLIKMYRAKAAKVDGIDSGIGGRNTGGVQPKQCGG